MIIIILLIKLQQTSYSKPPTVWVILSPTSIRTMGERRDRTEEVMTNHMKCQNKCGTF